MDNFVNIGRGVIKITFVVRKGVKTLSNIRLQDMHIHTHIQIHIKTYISRVTN